MHAAMQAAINVAKTYSDTPGPRKRNQRSFSAEEFREAHLQPAFLEAKRDNSVLAAYLSSSPAKSAFKKAKVPAI